MASKPRPTYSTITVVAFLSPIGSHEFAFGVFNKAICVSSIETS